MEKRTSIEVEEVTTTFFEATLKNNKNRAGYEEVEVKDNLKDLQRVINIYLKDSNWSLVGVEKVERILVKLKSA